MDGFLRRQRQSVLTLLMLSPGFAGFLGLFFYPMLVTMVRSLRPEGQNVGWTLANYVEFLSKPGTRQVIVLTFVLAITSTLLSMVLSVPLTLVLREKLWGHRFFRLTILIPITVPGLVGALGLLVFYGSRGWPNLFITQILHLPKLNINYTIPGLILFYLWHYFPYTALTTLTTLEGLDRSIEEAASVSGANGWQVLRHIVLPLIAPGILAGSVLTFMAAFGSFSIPLVTGGNYRPLSVAIYTQIASFTPARWSMGSAMSVVMAVL
jgi:putative spermidine/putrescine transport system permease protein